MLRIPIARDSYRANITLREETVEDTSLVCWGFPRVLRVPGLTYEIHGQSGTLVGMALVYKSPLVRIRSKYHACLHRAPSQRGFCRWGTQWIWTGCHASHGWTEPQQMQPEGLELTHAELCVKAQVSCTPPPISLLRR